MPVFTDGNPFWESVDEIPSEGGTPYDWERKRTYTRKHQVVVKLEPMGPTAVCLCPGLPLAGSFYVAPIEYGGIVVPIESDPRAIMIRQHADRKYPNEPGKWKFWIVTSEYSTDIPHRSDTPSSDDPSKDLADVAWDHESTDEVLTQDLFGTPYLNTAFDPLLRPPKNEVDYPILSITRNELTYNFGTAAYYNRSLNDDTFLGVPRGCVQCLPPRSNQKNIGVFRYWRTSYKLRVRPMQFNPSGTTDPNDRYRLPPLFLILPMTTGDGTGHTTYASSTFEDVDAYPFYDGGEYFINKYANCGPAGWPLVGIDDDYPNDYIGQLRGTPVYDSSGNVRYLSSRTSPTGTPGEPFQVRMWDSWQPLIQMEGLNRLMTNWPFNSGGPEEPDNIEVYGTKTAIRFNGVDIHHPVLLNDRGQQSQAFEGIKLKDLTPDQRNTPPPVWYKQLVHRRYTSLSTLLVTGLT